MKTKLLSTIEHRREWVMICDPGDDAMSALEQFAAQEELAAAHFTGIGAFANVTVAWFNLEQKRYEPIEINEQVEVLSLMGDVAEAGGKPSVHAHICVAKRDGSAHGGHLKSGRVRPTLELVIIESPGHLRKSFRAEFGIPLINLAASSAEQSAAMPP